MYFLTYGRLLPFSVSWQRGSQRRRFSPCHPYPLHRSSSWSPLSSAQTPELSWQPGTVWERRRVKHTQKTATPHPADTCWLQSAFEHFYLELLDIDVSRSIGVKQLKGLPDLLLLLLGQLWFGGGLLARRWHRTLQGWPLGTGRLVGAQEGRKRGEKMIAETRAITSMMTSVRLLGFSDCKIADSREEFDARTSYLCFLTVLVTCNLSVSRTPLKWISIAACLLRWLMFMMLFQFWNSSLINIVVMLQQGQLFLLVKFT